MNHAKYADFEHQLEVTPTSQNDVFKALHPVWHTPHRYFVNGSVMLGQAALAAYRTVPEGFEIYAVHAHFIKAAKVEITLHYHVERTSTTSRMATRVVRVTQNGVVSALVTLSFLLPAKEDEMRQPFHHVPEASKETLEAAAKTIDSELDDSAGWSVVPKDWPGSGRYPAISTQRLKVSNEEEVSKRIYRCRVRTLSSLSSPTAQIIATIFVSDLYVLDTPLTVQNIPFGMSRIGDRTKTPTKGVLKNFTTLNHTLHFVKSSGWDVHEGLLMECVTTWAKGRRATVRYSFRDGKGQLVATGEQEGFFMFDEAASAQQSKM